MKLVLRVIKGPHEGREFAFDRHITVVVGRSAEAQISFSEDRSLSRHHFLLEINPPLCFLRDLGSTNGTKVNDVRLERARLCDGDLITAGKNVFLVQLEQTGGQRITCRGCGAIAPLEMGLSQQSSSGPVNWYCEACSTRRRRFPDAPNGYWIERWIGGGGMGEVFLGRRLADNCPVAIKTMMPTVAASERARNYFRREVSVLRNLRHPNIVAFHEVIEDDGTFLMVMEYVDGQNSRDWVRNLEGPLPLTTAASIGHQLLSALQLAHERGYVHRDIKPSNLLIMGGPRRPVVKVSDFGLAKSFRDDAGFQGLTLEGDFGGSMGFVSPDHIRDFGEAREPADIYSAGATLYYLLTGQYPFLNFDPTQAEAITMTLEHPSVPLRAHRPDAPEALERVLRKALEKRPADRWKSAAAMAHALHPFQIVPDPAPDFPSTLPDPMP
ncbi:hypothetical protein BH23PLA1_BH23PLA1_29150 [soil metagenome]